MSVGVYLCLFGFSAVKRSNTVYINLVDKTFAQLMAHMCIRGLPEHGLKVGLKLYFIKLIHCWSSFLNISLTSPGVYFLQLIHVARLPIIRLS